MVVASLKRSLLLANEVRRRWKLVAILLLTAMLVLAFVTASVLLLNLAPSFTIMPP